MEIQSYKDLIVWQKSMDLVVAVYELSEQYPKTEMYGLTSQTRRSAVSIPSNIAEGNMRGTRKDYCHFLLNAYASGGELETQIELAKRLPMTKHLNFEKVDNLLVEILKMLNTLIRKMRDQGLGARD
ncbi:MAG: four helix bundle protein [Patescibacteria group bacterium]